MKKYVYYVLCVFLILAFFSTMTHAYWIATYGGSLGDMPTYHGINSLCHTPERGYIIVGQTWSFGAGNSDGWVLKLRADGTIDWQKTYGGIDEDLFNTIALTQDGGYILAGATTSFGASDYDFWVLKIDAGGSIVWQKRYERTGNDNAHTIIRTIDGGYLVAGWTASSAVVKGDIMVLKLNANGDIIWQKTYGGADEDNEYLTQQTSDGGYIICGYTKSFGRGSYDAWVLKLDNDGNVIWGKAYGGHGIDYAHSIRQTGDGGYIVAGGTDSFGAGDHDVWVLKLDSIGNIIWQKAYGETFEDKAYSVIQTTGGGYFVGGITKSFGGDGSGLHYDAWLLKLREDGNISWQRAYGGSVSISEFSYTLLQTSKGFLVGGKTGTFGAGKYDLMLLNLDNNGNIPGGCSDIKTTSNAIVTQTNVSSGIDTSFTVKTPIVMVYTPSATVSNTAVTRHIVCKSPLPGDCDDDGIVSHDELEECLNEFLGIMVIQACNDLNGDGKVTIDEVQKVINAYLED